MENQKEKTEIALIGTSAMSFIEQIAKVAENLSKAEVVDVDLAADYWSPTQTLESKKLIFMGIQDRVVDDISNPGESKILPTAFFVEKVKQGDTETLKRVCNASKKLLGVIQDVDLKPSTPVLITYLGKVKNKTNQFSSDTWSVKPMKIEI